MDQLCTKCGAGVPADARFCAICGAEIPTASSAPPPFTPMQSAASADYTPVSEPFTPVAQPASTGYSAVPQSASGYTPVETAAPAYGAAPQAGAGYTPVPPAGAGSAPPPTQLSPGYTAVPGAAAAGYSSVPPPPPNPPRYTAVPGAGGFGSAPMGSPPRSGSSAVKIVLIIVAIFVGFGLIGASILGFAVWRVAHAVHMHGNHGDFSVNTPRGMISAHSATNFTAEELGTDIYPGAQSTPGGMKMSLPTGSMVTAVFLTSDSKDTVRDFYKAKLGSGASVFDSGDGVVLSVNKSPEEHVMVTVSARENENDGKTKIVIVHSKKNGS